MTTLMNEQKLGQLEIYHIVDGVCISARKFFYVMSTVNVIVVVGLVFVKYVSVFICSY